MTNPVRDAGLSTLSYVRNLLYEMLQTIPAGEMLRQPSAGANHPLWIVGHLAVGDDQIRSALGGGQAHLPEKWVKMFGTGSTPTSQSDAYPPYDEVHRALTESRQRLLDWFEGMSDDDLRRPLPESWQGFAPTYGALISALAAHEALHVGQLSVVRRSLGLKPVEM